MTGKPMTTAQILEILAATPAHITMLTAEVSADRLQWKPAPDVWSANDILAHLRSCADMWGSCIATILAETHPTIRAINPTTWIDQTDYPQLPFQHSFQAYTAQRSELLATLRSLPPEAWLRTATITGAGKPLERTVQFYAGWLARHERSHLKPLGRALAD